MNIEQIINQLKEQGCRITPQRTEIIKILFTSRQHPKAEDIYRILHEKMPDVSLATIYNTLNRLKDLGLVNITATDGENSVRYDPQLSPHDHLYCLNCSRIMDVEQSHADLNPTSNLPEFRIVRQQTIYYGYCQDCQNRLNDEQSTV